MRVIICGAGQVGRSIAEQLSEEGNIITVIDENACLVNNISDALEVKGIIGNPSYPAILKLAQAEEADMIIAVTPQDNTNMVICCIAHSLFKVKKKIARIRSQEYLSQEYKSLFNQNNIPIDVVIYPESEVAKIILDVLRHPGLSEVISFTKYNLKLAKIKSTPESELIGSTVGEIKEHIKKYDATIIAIIHKGVFCLAKDKMTLDIDDEMYFICADDSVSEIVSFFGHNEAEVTKIRIIGGGNIGLEVAIKLEDDACNVKIIENDQSRAEYIAGKLNEATVIQGNAIDQNLLLDSNIDTTDILLAVSNDDQVNILSSLLARKLGCKNTVALVNNTSFFPLFSSLGIDMIINPREITISTILKYIRRGNVEDVHTIAQGKAEVVEIEVLEYSYIIGKKIEDLNLNSGIEIVLIIRDEQVCFPESNFKFQVRDKVIVIFVNKMLKVVEEIFSKELKYF